MKSLTIDHLTPLQKTLLITLNGRVVDGARSRPLLGDTKAAELAGGIDYDLGTVKLTSGVPEAVAIRSAMLDRAVESFVRGHSGAVVVELGCGLETRRSRLTSRDDPIWRDVDWYDVDFPEVIELRDALMPPPDRAHSVGVSLLDPSWTETIPADRPAVIVADGVLGFLSEEENRQVLGRITDHFAEGLLVFNAYTKFTARMNGRFTKVVGMPEDFRGFGIADPKEIVALNPALTFIDEQFGDAAPERDRLNLAYRLLARVFAKWRGQARRGVWIVRYRF
ncbi:class I SAM-dependent methyltransferase [Glycomyces buryatensis]|uniref:Class I SAM-dependent methyltransferase n=1 Tax=Glycomyces buryatensis TaxID=2570927 RepID=A0A4S8QMU0_9ACTN|nr:class I SAM-dependent methyltransferase [Glycomyces buryatensis]THV42044.1 class I SAM-dependent methyltransferase [Glycomyces buryatensis]